MVSDVRLSALLNRLGGLYRDPNRVDRDASSLLKSSVGKHLVPSIAALFENNGDTCHTVCLKGTISIHFRGQEYQQLMDIYLPPGYPSRPPVCYVRLATPNMYLKENHPHVGSDGQVYLPYLHEWNANSHTLIELVVAMSSVFSADPPVFTRTTPAPPPPPPPPPVYNPYNGNTNNNNNHHNSTILSQSLSERDAVLRVQEQIALEESRKEAEALAEVRRREEEEARQRAAQEEWDAKNFSSTKEKVRRKLHAFLQEHSQTVQQQIQMDMLDQMKLVKSEEQLVSQIQFLNKTKVEWTEQHTVIDKALVDIQTLIDAVQEQKRINDNQGSAKTNSSIDECVRPASVVDAQMLQLSAENASYSDALYFLDVALHNRVINLSTHLKEVRNLAKKQFMARAHLLKLSQTRMTQAYANHNHHHNFSR